jgi:hypothetical protein
MERNMPKPAGLTDFLKSRGYLSEEEAAAALNRTVRTLQLWRQQRAGPKYTTVGGVKGGAQVIYHESWLTDYLLANAKQPVRERERRGKRERASHHAGSGL